jgi:hypothetical protein
MTMGEFNRVQMADSDGNEVGKAADPQGFFAQDSQGNYGGQFLDQDALAKAVSDERYATDPEYRRIVQDLVQRTSEGVLAGHQPKYDGRAVEAMEVETDWLTTQMSRPEYKTSALFRRQVMEQIARSQSTVRYQGGNDQGCHKVSLSMDSSVEPMKK